MQKIFEQDYADTINRVFVVDEPGPGNGCHQYRIEIEADGAEFCTETNFQKGPVKEVGLNGIQNEHLLAMVIHRLQGFQSGPYACEENALALTRMREAMYWLEARTKDRAQRGVEGSNQK
ncbi:hypothetical protein D0962_05635 [Leptolyngbyaceae cyanobacterium CCMR0082]|uniref:Acb2/Tad1 hairpin domain-containing protein n=1 Tax=Adonisia turfae CCMR0082 TaxID=2304604 RepID=A0A6M0S2Q0_9CYAN|nr:hypothetical protein [Adonisia turfae]NEZ62261.1 hypothetical protein [Adonisia turfae CCMR0082]